MVKGQLTTSQVKDVEERARSAKESAEKAIRAAWTHLLYATKDEAVLDGKPFDVEQTTLLARDRSSISISAYEKLSPRSDSIVKEVLGPKILIAKLNSLWPPAVQHLSIAEVREWFAAYVYLPKLRDPSVLESAIAEGVSGADPQFGYADGFDAATGRYHDLYYGRMAPTSFAADALLVRGNAARAQQDEVVPVPQPTGADTSFPPAGDRGHPPAPPSEPAQPTRFFGSVDLDPARPIRSFETIFNAVIAQLQSANGTTVKLTLEIEAQARDGFIEADVGVVRDNAKQLKFKTESTGFE